MAWERGAFRRSSATRGTCNRNASPSAGKPAKGAAGRLLLARTKPRVKVIDDEPTITLPREVRPMTREFLVAPVDPDPPAAAQVLTELEQALASLPEAEVVGRIGERILLVRASPAAVARLRDSLGAKVRIEENQGLNF